MDQLNSTIKLIYTDLKLKAKKKGTYKKALEYLSELKPPMQSSYVPTTEDVARNLFREIIEDVKRDLRDEALTREVKHE